MMKLHFVGASLLAMASLSAPAWAGSELGQPARGVYLRMDSGYSWAQDSSVHQNSTTIGVAQGDATMGSAWLVGGGVGYRFTNRLRMDATLTYRGDYESKGNILFGGQTFTDTANVDSLDGMVSAYWDIATVKGVTPYLGGGIGLAHNMQGKTQSVRSDGTRFGTTDSNDHDSFAWQVTAGASYDLVRNVSLDVSYHYVDLGDVWSGDSYTNTAGVVTTGIASKTSLTAHEAQLGLRYSF